MPTKPDVFADDRPAPAEPAVPVAALRALLAKQDDLYYVGSLRESWQTFKAELAALCDQAEKP